MAGVGAAQANAGQYMMEGVAEAAEIITESGGIYEMLGIGEEIAAAGEAAQKRLWKNTPK